MKYYLGIDLGGTFIKGAVIDSDAKILISDKVPTESELGSTYVINNIASLCESLIKKSGFQKPDFVGIGVGVPGIVESKTGRVTFADNIHWHDVPLVEKLERLLALPVKIGNDANLATLGELKFGIGKKYNSAVMLTLGTGVGGGIIVDGKIIEGNGGAGAELGHCVISVDGEPCACGRCGCLEAYASATALIRDTKRAMKKNPESLMWEIGSTDKVTGKTAFDYYDRDEAAREVVDRYIKMLSCGIINFANVFRPEIVILGGGVCAQGENLTRPLREILDKELFAKGLCPDVLLTVASLGNDAGSLGAAALFMDV